MAERGALPRLKLSPPRGRRPSLEFRRLDELQVDSVYQRSVAAEASQSLIRRIAQSWDWSLCQPLAVAKRGDGTLVVVDGQHRLEAARLRADIEDLPCVVASYQSAGEEAAAFVALNQQRRPLSAIDLFKASLAAEDASAGTICRLLTEAGLRLAPHTNFTAWKPGMVSNISGIQACFRVHGERVTELALRALAAGFEGQVLRYAGSLFPGIHATVAQELNVEGSFDADRLASALRGRSQDQWKQEIALEQASTGVERKLAAKKVVAAAYRATPPRPAAPPPSPIIHALKPAPDPAPRQRPAEVATRGPVLDLRWCEQCEQRVSAGQADACGSPWCKAKGGARHG